MKFIKIKKTGVETAVSDAYYDQYVGDGWFIEINGEPEKKLKEPEMLIVEAPKKATKTKE